MVLPESTRRQIGQHFILGFHPPPPGSDPTIPPDTIKTLIQEYYVGAVILMKRNVPRDSNSEDPEYSALHTHALIANLQKLAREAGHTSPLLIGTDQENGLVSAMGGALPQFPGAMTLAATSNAPSNTSEAYASTGKMLKLLGVTWAFAPIADVNSDSANPVIGVRAFSSSPSVVSTLAQLASRAFAQSGVAASLKHFPGHGDTGVDSHLALPSIDKPLSSLQSTELLPFRDATDAPSVMTAHISVPALDAFLTPASLSHTITTGLLKREMGYKGVVVTDCLEMEAVSKLEPDPALLALRAGADVAMICHTYEKHLKAINAVYDAVEAGEDYETWLGDSARRIERLKQDFVGTWDDVITPTLDREKWEEEKRKGEELAKRVYRESTTVLREPPSWLNGQEKVLVFTPMLESLNKAVDDAEGVERDQATGLAPTKEDGQKKEDEDETVLIDKVSGAVRNTAGASYAAFVRAIARRSSATRHIVYTPDTTDLDLDVKEGESVVIALRNAHLAQWQLDWVRKVLGDKGRGKVVIVSTCAPYDLVGLETDNNEYAHVATYEYTAPALEACVEVLFGERKARGVCPVEL